MLEVFNKVEAHLLLQGAKSVDCGGECLYRGEDGMSCAIGCLIKDEFYHEGLEGIAMWADEKKKERLMILEEALINSGIELSPAMTYMLSDLQYMHDTNSPKVWEQELQHMRVTHFGDGK